MAGRQLVPGDAQNITIESIVPMEGPVISLVRENVSAWMKIDLAPSSLGTPHSLPPIPPRQSLPGPALCLIQSIMMPLRMFIAGPSLTRPIPAPRSLKRVVL